MGYLPTDISSFVTMREEGYIYVDKTKQIYELIKKGASRYYFLSRPRRFGKTLLISTLKELFSGNRRLFDGLWIATSDYQWIEHPVIHLDFGSIDHRTVAELKQALEWALREIACNYSIDISDAPTLASQLTALIKRLAQKNKVVVLIDEYDKPILDHIQDQEQAIEHRDFLKSFYDPLKSVDEHLRAIFMTGVTKFSKTSLFSGLNNLNDITLDPVAASLLGYTQEEIDSAFRDHIAELASSLKKPKEALKNDMKQWYNGYCFSKEAIKVYNPFSLLYLFKKREFANYWFESGTPSFMVRLLEKQYSALEEVSEFEISPSSLGTFELNNIPLITLLFQTGYLTIVAYNKETNRFRLDYPNFEVEESFKKYLLGVLSYASTASVDAALVRFVKALQEKNIDLFCSTLEQLFAHTLYTAHTKGELLPLSFSTSYESPFS